MLANHSCILCKVGLKVRPSNCVLLKRDIEFLGHLIPVQGVDPVPDKLKAIRDWPTPHCLRDIRAFFGLASYFCRFIRNFASIAEPLTRLTKKNTIFKWTDEAELAFCRLKQALLDETTLAFIVPGRPCILDTDACDVAVGRVLLQVVDGVERPIVFYSSIMSSIQRNYCPTRRELLSVIAALQHFNHYLLGTHVIFRTDHHSLKWLKAFKRPDKYLPDGSRRMQNSTIRSNIDLIDSTAMLMACRGPSANNTVARTSQRHG